MSYWCNRNPMTAQQHQNTVALVFHKKTHPGKKHLAWKSRLRHSWEICCRKYTVSALPKLQRKYEKHVSWVNVNNSIKLQVGSKHRTRIKNLLKASSQRKRRPFLNTVQKTLDRSSIILSSKIWPQSDKQQSNTAALENECFFKMSYLKNKSKKILLWKLLQTSFCAAHTAITKCTPLKPTQSQEYQPGKKNH